MGAATRASTARAVEALTALKRPDAAIGPELLAAARAVASSHQLTAVLADPGVPEEQREALVSRVFAASKPQTRQLLAALVSGRWSDADDLVGGIEELGFRALAAGARGDGLERELFVVQRTIASDGVLELALGGQAAPAEARTALVDAVLTDAKPATREIVRHVVLLPRGRKPVEGMRHAQQVVAEARGLLVAVVQVARPLTDAQADALADRLQTAYGRKISVNQVIDPALVGGVRVTVGDEVIDGTVRARLDDLRQRLAG
ncbi:F0F1 ATP synthase subunit delta [Amnibacterium endophyticum]|uniref:ATP synthase subunit delta n=1 Tax=Amnibacterium endophyticum TaxID=2109337 RepID=A0ABW4LHN4_9MICO